MTTESNTHAILGTAGHIDHGKSSLIQALTGTDPDRLVEEKRRGITIELGFAQLDLDDHTSLGVVDVPGHERFVRQMIAGASGIDIALLCIAADDGIMPQTTEHRAVLELLGIPRCVVALTKSDLVDAEWLDMMSVEVRSFLQDTPYADAAIVPVSSRTGQGLEELKAALADTLKDVTRDKAGDLPRLPIDRVFSIKGSGTVVTGTLWSGTLTPDTAVTILPSDTVSRIRSVQVHGHDVEQANQGQRVAVNLVGLKTTDLHPGDFLTLPGAIEPRDRFDVSFTYFDTRKSGKPFKSGTLVHVAHGTKEVIGRVLLMNGRDLLRSGESCFAQIRTEETLPVSWGDRFIVRSYSPVHVIGGGTILLTKPRHRTNLTDGEIALLEALQRDDSAEASRLVVTSATTPLNAATLADVIGITESAAANHLSSARDAGLVAVLGDDDSDWFATPSVKSRYVNIIENSLLAFHTNNPERTGISKKALQQQCVYRGADAGFDALLSEAARAGKIVFGEGEISHPRAGGGAKKLEEQTAAKVLDILRAQPLQPPVMSELIRESGADAKVVHRSLGTLEKEGLVKKVSTELTFLSESLSQLEESVRKFFATSEEATVADLTQAMGSSRKYSVPILEYFDAQGMTVREGNLRRLRK